MQLSTPYSEYMNQSGKLSVVFSVCQNSTSGREQCHIPFHKAVLTPCLSLSGHVLVSQFPPKMMAPRIKHHFWQYILRLQYYRILKTFLLHHFLHFFINKQLTSQSVLIGECHVRFQSGLPGLTGFMDLGAEHRLSPIELDQGHVNSTSVLCCSNYTVT